MSSCMFQKSISPPFGGESRGEGSLFTAFLWQNSRYFRNLEKPTLISQPALLLLITCQNGDRRAQIDPLYNPRCRTDYQERALRLDPIRASRNHLHHPRRNRRNSRCCHKSADRIHFTPILETTITKTGEYQGHKRFCAEDG